MHLAQEGDNLVFQNVGKETVKQHVTKDHSCMLSFPNKIISDLALLISAYNLTAKGKTVDFDKVRMKHSQSCNKFRYGKEHDTVCIH